MPAVAPPRLAPGAAKGLPPPLELLEKPREKLISGREELERPPRDKFGPLVCRARRSACDAPTRRRLRTRATDEPSACERFCELLDERLASCRDALALAGAGTKAAALSPSSLAADEALGLEERDEAAELLLPASKSISPDGSISSTWGRGRLGRVHRRVPLGVNEIEVESFSKTSCLNACCLGSSMDSTACATFGGGGGIVCILVKACPSG